VDGPGRGSGSAGDDPGGIDRPFGGQRGQRPLDAADVLARLVDEAAGAAMAALRAEAQVAPDPLAVGEMIGWLNLRIMELREPTTRQVALDELLDWLLDDGSTLPDDDPAVHESLEG
jgi:hypothetical protein